MWPKNVLMVSPDFFDVTYAINPYMVDEVSGGLKQIDKNLALQQWQSLKKAYAEQGLSVHTIDGVADLPDMVFSANQTFPFYKNGQVRFVMSRMKSPFRQREVDSFRSWCLNKNIESYEIPEGLSFEGMGDALWNYESEEIFGGYGFRTDVAVYDWLSALTQKPVIKLHLVNDHFYHLDTALCILNRETALYVPKAFSAESVDKLRMKFKNLLAVPEQEAHACLAVNACSIDGKTVFVEKQAVFTQQLLKQLGFELQLFDTSEYIKSGGSVFCLKLLF
ncbi:amidinotransferase [bacterium]|nr:amidinotransferase [bacterium]